MVSLQSPNIHYKLLQMKKIQVLQISVAFAMMCSIVACKKTEQQMPEAIKGQEFSKEMMVENGFSQRFHIVQHDQWAFVEAGIFDLRFNLAIINVESSVAGKASITNVLIQHS